MIEYPAMIYKNDRTKTFVANCMMKNLFGFGKTEQDALENLKSSIKTVCKCNDFNIKAVSGLLF